ncbi:hypothetical protein VTN00DRAFT_9167 [Thermoascus crustaceus]|uniref:uncharacterized protein n=1 Tax=Thermoascus crustaceus TaxID=5088 RepID=UPI003743BC3F
MMDPSTALQVKITSAVPQNTDVQQGPTTIKVNVSVYNSADIPLTLLRWGTPLDPASGVLGVFEVRSLNNNGNDDGQVLQMDTIKLSRKLPPTVEDLVEIPAGGAVEAAVTLPPLQLHAGREYSVVTRGRWQAVWEGRMSDVTPEKLETLADAKAGGFVSDRAVVKINSMTKAFCENYLRDPQRSRLTKRFRLYPLEERLSKIDDPKILLIFIHPIIPLRRLY